MRYVITKEIEQPINLKVTFVISTHGFFQLFKDDQWEKGIESEKESIDQEVMEQFTQWQDKNKSYNNPHPHIILQGPVEWLSINYNKEKDDIYFLDGEEVSNNRYLHSICLGWVLGHNEFIKKLMEKK